MEPIPSKLLTIAQAQPYPLLFATVSGSHLYGFSSPDSDYDLRGVHILPLAEVIGLEMGRETIEASRMEDGLELDLVTHDVKKFFGLMLKKNGYVLEQLYSPLIVHTTPEHEELKAIAPHCIIRHHAHHYLGFARTQWRLFEKTTPHRAKPLLYVYRVLLTGIHLMQTGEIEAHLGILNEKFQLSYIPDLMAQKQQEHEKTTLREVDLAFYRGECDRLSNQLQTASDQSHLPDSPTARAALNDLLVRIRLSAQ
ncbi:MAG: nucleotidyltransferase domain-containing protein [Cyanobacteria bacterium P01_F01_bin.150]